MKRWIADFFCGAGGVTKGFQRAGFQVVGVDHEFQPNYCGEHFVEMDALAALEALVAGGELPVSRTVGFKLEDFAGAHASPPCPFHSSLNGWSGDSTEPDLIPQVRELLEQADLPYVIENVEGARGSLRGPVRICGQALGLKVRRHRLFESNFPIMAPPCWHPEPPVIVVGGSIGRKVFDPRRKAKAPSLEEAREVMDMPGCSARELANAIPPAYAELIGHQLMSFLKAEVAA